MKVKKLTSLKANKFASSPLKYLPASIENLSALSAKISENQRFKKLPVLSGL